MYGGINVICADASEKVESIDQLVAFASDGKKSGRGMRGDILEILGIPLEFFSHTDVIRISCEPVSTPLQFLIQFVEYDVRYHGRERTTLRGSFLGSPARSPLLRLARMLEAVSATAYR
jgi:hypothetical protein